jgi:hypothetical protein
MHRARFQNFQKSYSPLSTPCSSSSGTEKGVTNFDITTLIRPWTLPGQRRTGIRLRSGRVPDHDADMDLLCCPNRALRRGVYSSLRPGTRPRHSSGKACRARRSQGNRVTTVDRSGRQVIELQQMTFEKTPFGRVPEQCLLPVRKEQRADWLRDQRATGSKNCRSKVLVRPVQSQFAGPGGSVPHFDQHFNSPWNTLLDSRSSATCKPHNR